MLIVQVQSELVFVFVLFFVGCRNVVSLILNKSINYLCKLGQLISMCVHWLTLPPLSSASSSVEFLVFQVVMAVYSLRECRPISNLNLTRQSIVCYMDILLAKKIVK